MLREKRSQIFETRDYIVERGRKRRRKRNIREKGTSECGLDCAYVISDSTQLREGTLCPCCFWWRRYTVKGKSKFALSRQRREARIKKPGTRTENNKATKVTKARVGRNDL